MSDAIYTVTEACMCGARFAWTGPSWSYGRDAVIEWRGKHQHTVREREAEEGANGG